MIYDKLQMKGGKFYLEAEPNGREFTYVIKCHIQGEASDIILHKNIRKPLEAIKQLEYYIEQYSIDIKTEDAISDATVTITEYIEKYKTLTEFSKEKLLKKQLKGDGGIHELCKKWDIAYTKLSKEECINALIDRVEKEIG